LPLLLVAARLMHGPLPRLTRADKWAFVLISLTGLVCNTTMWYWGLQYTSPINAGILGAGAPVLVAIAGALWLGDPLAKRHYVGFALTMGAVLLTVSHGSLVILRTLSFNKGDLIILGSQWAWIAYSCWAGPPIPACRFSPSRRGRMWSPPWCCSRWRCSSGPGPPSRRRARSAGA
jgi:drug/metabolite transporter (DMT)-like permease